MPGAWLSELVKDEYEFANKRFSTQTRSRDDDDPEFFWFPSNFIYLQNCNVFEKTNPQMIGSPELIQEADVRNGKDVCAFSFDILRRSIGLVSHPAWLFTNQH